MSAYNFRMLVHFEPESEKWRVTVPEMPGFAVVGASRAEAVSAAEEELERHIDQLNMNGLEVPKPVDEEEWGTELSIELSASLHRELAFQAKWEKCELPELIVQMLMEGLNRRRSGRGGERRPQRDDREHGREGGRDRNDREGGRRGRRGGGGRGYQQVMYDGASFREYVRSIEPEGGRRPPKKRRGGGGSKGGSGNR